MGRKSGRAATTAVKPDDGVTLDPAAAAKPGTADGSREEDASADSDDDDDDDGRPRFSFFGASVDDVELTDSDDPNGDSEPDPTDAEGVARGAKRARPAAPPLPSVATLFAENVTPSYMERPSFAQEAEIEAFDRRAKPEARPQRWLKKSQTVEVRAGGVEAMAAQPLPATGIAAEVQRAAMMNSAAYKDTVATDAPAKTPIAELNKRSKQPKGEPGTKSQQSFAAKEKRKRDLGMSARGKSTVEEEKRVLRQEYANAGLGFD